MLDPPRRLRVEVDLDGFRCQLPGEAFGPNSSWILVFVPAWWAVSAAVAMVVARQFPAFMDGQVDGLRLLLGAIGVLGWGPGWYLFDAWRVRSRTRPFEADAVGIRYEGVQHLFSAITKLEVVAGGLYLHAASGSERIPLGTNATEDAWLGAKILQLHTAAQSRRGVVPSSIEAMLER